MSSVAIIGQGYMANAHATAWAGMGKAGDITYVCSPRPVAGSVAPATNAQYVSTLDTILADETVTFVSVCTPTPTHREIALALLAAGKHTLLEKPIALTVDDALAIAKAVKESSGSLMVAQVVRFFDGYQRIRAARDAGDFGDLLSVRARRFSSKPDWAPWMADDDKSGGMLVDFSTHDFDQLNLFLGNPREVCATQSAPDAPAHITVSYEGGGVGHVESFMNNSAGVPFTSTIDVLGTSGLGHYEFSAVSATETSADEPDSSVNKWHVFSAAGNRTGAISDDDPYGRQISYFWNQASSGLPFDVAPLHAAIAALAVSLAAKQSLSEGRPVAVSSPELAR